MPWQAVACWLWGVLVERRAGRVTSVSEAGAAQVVCVGSGAMLTTTDKGATAEGATNIFRTPQPPSTAQVSAESCVCFSPLGAPGAACATVSSAVLYMYTLARRQGSDGERCVCVRVWVFVPWQVLRFLSGVMTAPRLMNTSNEVGTVEPGRCVSVCACSSPSCPCKYAAEAGGRCLSCRPTRINFADTATAALLLGEKDKWDTCDACAYVGGAKAALAAHSIACSFAPVPPGLMRDIIRGQIEQQFPLPEGVSPSFPRPSRHCILHACVCTAHLAFRAGGSVAELGEVITQPCKDSITIGNLSRKP